jgi:hypothetical protein
MDPLARVRCPLVAIAWCHRGDTAAGLRISTMIGRIADRSARSNNSQNKSPGEIPGASTRSGEQISADGPPDYVFAIPDRKPCFQFIPELRSLTTD